MIRRAQFLPSVLYTREKNGAVPSHKKISSTTSYHIMCYMYYMTGSTGCCECCQWIRSIRCNESEQHSYAFVLAYVQ